MSNIINCSTCVHKFNGDNHMEFAKCARTYLYCSTMRKVIHDDICDINFSGWRSITPPPPKPPKPPARSFRQWVYDTFWKVSK